VLGPRGVIGIWDGHEASVSLVHDGRLVFALSEERPSRHKRCSGLPVRALQACLGWAADQGIGVGTVALAGRWGRAPLRLAAPLYESTDPHRDPLSPASSLIRGWESAVAGTRAVRRPEAAAGLLVPRRRLRRILGRDLPLVTVGHHRAHALAAGLAGPREHALVITWDAYGEGVAATCRRASAPDHVLATLPVSAGVARLWGALTIALGYREGDEGKLTGLAARGDGAAHRRAFEDLFTVAEDAPRLRRPLDARCVASLVAGRTREDVAAGLQSATEALVGGWIGRQLRDHGPVARLLLAGGLFANVRLVEAIAHTPGLRDVRVFAAMGDSGLSAGAASAAYRDGFGSRVRPVDHLFLGCGAEPAGLQRAAARSGLPWRRVADADRSAAAHLIHGRVVCRFRGREEFGPRALGHRSILFRADCPGLADRVGRALRRDRSMPFGPALRDEDLAWLDHPPAADTLRTMTRTVRAGADLRRLAPAAVHVDGSCRPQLVDRRLSPGLWTILDVQRRLGGPPALINTSFNLHGEPIVHSPGDAVRTFVRSGLDVLQLGDLELTRVPDDADCRGPGERAR
jgi:carbamoyltransferase